MKKQFLLFILFTLYNTFGGYHLKAEPTMPTLSHEGDTTWYYIEFSQRAWPSGSNNRYLCDLGDNSPLIAVPPVNTDGVLWKIEVTETEGEYRIVSKHGNSIGYASDAINGTDIAKDRYYSSNAATDFYKIELVNNTDFYRIRRVGGNCIDKSNTDFQFDAYESGDGVSVTFIPESSFTITQTAPAFAQNDIPSSLDFGKVEVNKPSDAKTVNILAYNLTGNLTYSLSGSDKFTVTPTSPVASSDGFVYVPLKVTAQPDADGAISATLTITGEGMDTELLINLTATGETPNLPVTLSTDNNEVWYYIKYSNRTDLILQDVGAGNNLVAAPADSTQAGQLWKVVSTGISSKYKIINKLRNEITRTGSNFASTASSGYNFRFDARTDAKWQIYCHETSGYINKENNNYVFGSYGGNPDDGSAVEFILPSAMPDEAFNFPKLSTQDDEYWYRIQFNRQASDNKVIQDNGLDSELTQAVAVDGQTSQYWKFTGKAQDYRIESYIGHEIAKLVGGDGSGQHYKAVAIGVGESHGAFKFNAPAELWKLRNNVMDRSGSTTGTSNRFLNDQGNGQYVNLYSGDDAGNALNFISVPAPPAEFSVETSSLSFDMVAVDLGKNLPVAVTARNLSDTIAYEITGDDAFLFAVDLSNSNWSKKRGGALSIAFVPAEVGTYSATLSITAGGTTETVSLTGSGSTDPYIGVKSTSLDFGNMIIGDDSAKSVEIIVLNLLEAGNFTYTQAGPDSAAFTITEASRTNDGVTLNVAFRPTERKNYSDTIVISSIGAETKKIVLTGAGITGFPFVSTSEETVWYYVEFSQRSWPSGSDNRYLYDLGDNRPLIAVPPVNANGVLWKIEATETSGEYRIESKLGNSIGYASDAINGTDIDKDRYYSSSAATDYYKIEPVNNGYYKITRVGGNGIDKSNNDFQFDAYGSGTGVSVSFIPEGSLTDIRTASAFAKGIPNALDFGKVEVGNPSDAKTVNILAYNLTGNLTYSLSGSDKFTVTPASPVAPSYGFVYVPLKVTARPDTVGEINATLKINTGTDVDTVLSINLTATGETPNLPVTVSTDNNEVWYYIEANRRTGQYYADLGEYKALEIRPALPDENGLLWKAVSAGISGKYRLISKNGNQIAYTNSGTGDIAAGRFYTTASSENTYSFAKRPDGAWQIRCNEENAYINKLSTTAQLTNNQFGKYGYMPDDGSSTVFIPASGIQFRLPIFSTDKVPAWYYLSFKKHPDNNIQGNGADKDVTQVAKAATSVKQFWRFAGTWDDVKIIGYEGLELKLAGSYYQLVAAGAGDAFKLYWNNAGNETGWRLINKSSTGNNLLINDNEGSRLGPWREDGGSGNGFDFVRIPLPFDFVIGAEAEVSASAYDAALYGNIVFKSTDAATGQLTDIPETGLRVNGVVQVEKTVTSGRDYPMGFPFAIKSVTDRYTLQSYDGTRNVFESAEKFEAGKGYLVRFHPLATVVTLTSAKAPTLYGFSSVSTADGYSLVANPSVINVLQPELIAGGVEAFYGYDYTTKAFTLLDGNATFTLKPFEALVTVKNVTPPLYGNIGDGTPVGLESIDADDPVVDVRYYDLQGRELQRLGEKGVYIVKKIHASRKVEISKIFYKN